MENQFKEWAYVELMGHNKICGLVSEHKFGNESMLRVDVPECGEVPPFSKLFNLSAIYAITPMSEPECREFALLIKSTPLDKFDMTRIIHKEVQKQLIPAAEFQDRDSDDQFDDHDLNF